MQFNNPKVAAAYEPGDGLENDLEINRSDYHGKLSNIDEYVAQSMADAGSIYIKVKAKPVVAKPADTK